MDSKCFPANRSSAFRSLKHHGHHPLGRHRLSWASTDPVEPVSRCLEALRGLRLAYVQRCTKYVQRKQRPESGTTGINRKLQQTSSCGSQSRSNPLRFVCQLTCSMLLAANLPIISSECIPKAQASPLQHDREATNPRLPNFHHISSLEGSSTHWLTSV